MSRIRTLFAVVVPSMIAGGLLFNAVPTRASTGDEAVFGFWPASAPAGPLVAQATPPPPPPVRPAPPVPPTPPAPPTPKAPKVPAAGGGISVSINNGKVQIDGIHDMVLSKLDEARAQVANNPSIPKDVRDKVLARLDKVRASVDKRLSNIKITDMDQFEKEMEAMGDEIEQAMDGLDKDMDQWSKQYGKDWGKQFGKNIKLKWSGNDNDNDDDDDDDIGSVSAPDVDADDDDMKDAIKDLRDLALDKQQKDQINKLRADSDKTVSVAKKQLDELSQKLQVALGNTATSDADIGRMVDQISAQEAAIRKARIVAWAQARRLLSDAQRKKVEAAAKKKTK